MAGYTYTYPGLGEIDVQSYGTKMDNIIYPDNTFDYGYDSTSGYGVKMDAIDAIDGVLDWGTPEYPENQYNAPGYLGLGDLFTGSFEPGKIGPGIQPISPTRTSAAFTTPAYYGDTPEGLDAQTTLDRKGDPFAWMDMNNDQVFNPGENYDPTSSVWNDWMNAR